jgi:hypothetical protein
MADKWRRLALGDTGVNDDTKASCASHEPGILGTSEPLRDGTSEN